MRTLTLFVIALSAGCVSKSKHQATLAELKKCQEERTGCGHERDAAQKRAADLERDLGEERGKREAAERDLAAMQENLKATSAEIEQLRAARAEAEKRLQAFKDLTAKFQKMIDTGRVKVTYRRGQMLLQLPAGILFASAKADLSEEGTKAIAEVAKILKEFPDRRWAVGGHTDNYVLPKKSQFKNNWELSTARALTVTLELIKNGVPPKALSATGFGEFDPLNKNKTEKERALNRRIEIILVPKIEEMPSMPAEAEQVEKDAAPKTEKAPEK
jgi:chemotaxis protein MotB